jgi:hypothetical protein
MNYKIEFQYKAVGDARPEDAVQDEEILFEGGEAIPVPNVGDSVSYKYSGTQRAFKVISRHFSYLSNWCVVNIVVTDMPSEEMAARLKE